MKINQLALTAVATLATLVAGNSLLAQQEPAKDTRSNNKGTAVRATDLSGHAAAHSGIPSCLTTLNLTQAQQDKIQAIVGKCDGDHAAVWKQFSERYMETIGVECTLLAAIEDNLTETQRNQVRGHRHQTAHSGKSPEAANDRSNDRATNRANNHANDRPTNPANDQSIASPGNVAGEEIRLVGVTLTNEQEAAADKLQGKYLVRLRSLNRDIEGLHQRLVSLEADKLVEIEKILTKEQLTQLREIRQNAPVSAKVASSRNAAEKPAN
ncbi:MAG: hypothetical protein RIK87_18780 [Fuerstiella sp.]